MVIDNIDELRQQQLESVSILGCLKIFLNSMEVPERRIGSVIETLLLPFRKHIRYQAVANVVAKRSQNVARFCVTSCNERQAFKTDHRVTAPIGEPVV